MNRLWLRQGAAVIRIELVKNLFALRAAPLYLLVALPLFVTALILVVYAFDPGDMRGLQTLAGAAMLYAYLYEFILRFVVYAGCAWIFMNLFRGEILDRSLHFYFLAPIRREVLVASKFVSGWLAATLLFVAATVGPMALLYGAFGARAAARHLLAGPGLGQLVAYAGVTALAALGYGAVFLAAGLFFRNVVTPALLIWAWEAINPFLPALLKKVSVIFYLRSLLPIAIDEGPFAVLADPVPAWLAVPGLLLFTAATLVAAAIRVRRMEVVYGD